MIDTEVLREAQELNAIDGPYTQSVLGAVVVAQEGSADVDEILAIRDRFMEANPGVVECLEVVARAVIEASDGDQELPNMHLPEIATDFGNIPGTGWPPSRAIGLVLDKIIRAQSGGKRFARNAYPSYYEPPQFVGTQTPTSHFWSVGLEDADNPADKLEDFRPPYIIAVAIRNEAITVVDRLSDEHLAAITSQGRRAELRRVASSETEQLLADQLAEAYEAARMSLTDPGISVEAALVAQNNPNIGWWALHALTHPANKRYSPDLHRGITYDSLLYIAQLALADKRV